MLLHYLKIALRNLSPQRGLALINVLGLSIGLACFCLFLLYTLSEFSYDNFHRNGRNIYCVSEQRDGQPLGDAYLYMPLGPALKRDFPDVVNYVRLSHGWSGSFVRTGGAVTRSDISYADPQLFSVFSFPLLAGSPASILPGTRSVVLTKDKALQLFGTTEVMGKALEIKIGEQFEPFTVSGVAQNIPANSSIRFEVLLPFAYLLSTPGGMEGADNWYRTGNLTYVQLREGSRLAEDTQRLQQFTWKYHPEEKERAAKGEPQGRFLLRPLLQLHTDTSLEGAMDPQRVWMLLCIAAGVLLIACINFTTLAIGRSAGRATLLTGLVAGSYPALVLSGFGPVQVLPLQYSFLDQDIDRYYKNEARLSRIIGWAGGIAVFLACMGLFGLAALAAVNRTQEIGIRKVMGASPAGIVTLLSKDFLRLVVIALLIASPLAWYCMHRWLDNFAYRISIRWEVFVLTGVIAMLTALATTGMHTLKAAMMNPAGSLRNE